MSKLKQKRSFPGWLIPCAAALLATVGLLVARIAPEPAPTEPAATEPSYPLRVEDAQQVSINLGYGLYLVDVAKYTGVYMEDGTDEVVSGVLMVVVENTGTQDIQYAEIALPVGEETACFSLSDLPAGERVVLLEKNRMAYRGDISYTTATCQNVAVFPTPMDLCADQLQIQGSNGMLNIINISDGDIDGNVVIYYKNSAVDMLYGGITYRVVLAGGLPEGESRQIPAGHYSAAGSRIVHITIGEAQ